MKVENELFYTSLSPSGKNRKSSSGSSDSKYRKNKSDDDPIPKLSYKFKDKNIKLSNDRLTCVGYKGWTSIFSTHCSSVGKWYYEVIINQDFKNLKFVGQDPSIKHDLKGHVRVGYACRYQRYDMPVGINTFGFSISDVDGKAFYNRVKYPYAIPFSSGDIIGCYLNLEKPTTNFYDPRGDLKLYEFLREGMLCDPKNIPPADTNPDSYGQFSINGQLFPKLSIDVYDGFYHPAISLYMGASVTVNLGPNFINPPSSDYKPCCLMDKPLIN